MIGSRLATTAMPRETRAHLRIRILILHAIRGYGVGAAMDVMYSWRVVEFSDINVFPVSLGCPFECAFCDQGVEYNIPKQHFSEQLVRFFGAVDEGLKDHTCSSVDPQPLEITCVFTCPIDEPRLTIPDPLLALALEPATRLSQGNREDVVRQRRRHEHCHRMPAYGGGIDIGRRLGQLVALEGKGERRHWGFRVQPSLIRLVNRLTV